MLVWLSKMVLPQHKIFAQFIADGKRHSKAWRLPEKECNKLDLTAAPCFWLANHNNYLGALLLVVSHLFAVPVLVLWVGLEKNKKKQNLDVRNILAGSNTELEMLLDHIWLSIFYKICALEPCSSYAWCGQRDHSIIS